jgi:5-methylcytosine-specific restriction endonuclease McrA
MTNVGCSICGGKVKAKGLCRKHYVAAWQAQHPDMMRVYRVRYEGAHKAEKAARALADRLANPEKFKVRHAAYRAANVEKERARHQSKYAAKRDQYLETNRAWAAANPLICRARSARRRARKRAAEGRFTEKDVQALYRAQAGCCAQCRIDFSGGYHVDHIIALAVGGSNWPENLQLLCPPCNWTKGTRPPKQSREARP